jgi:hypothetical protein
MNVLSCLFRPSPEYGLRTSRLDKQLGRTPGKNFSAGARQSTRKTWSCHANTLSYKTHPSRAQRSKPLALSIVLGDFLHPRIPPDALSVFVGHGPTPRSNRVRGKQGDFFLADGFGVRLWSVFWSEIDIVSPGCGTLWACIEGSNVFCYFLFLFGGRLFLFLVLLSDG